MDEVARHLLGCHVVAGDVRIRLTEVEAYGGADDPASHAWRGRTPRTATMFGPAGNAYVYFTYGMHHCLNVVTGPEGEAAAVLLRAGEVVAGEDVVTARRPRSVRRDLARGPARLCVALGVDRSYDGTDLLAGSDRLRLELTDDTPDPQNVLSGPRVGVTRAADVPWRFWLAADPTVSAYRPAAPRRPTTR